MSDIEIVYYSCNHLDKVNPSFVAKTREALVQAAGDIPIVCVSHEPLSFGSRNIVVGPVPRGHLQIYKNILVGAKHATAPFVALAEDDIFYPASHFRTYRPPAHKFAYDLNRWGINTWVEPPMYGYRNRPVVNQLLAPRLLLIEALEERFAAYPDESKVPLKFWGDLGRYEGNLGVTIREFECYAAPDCSVVFSHEEAFGYLNHGKRKSIGHGARTWLPKWGFAKDMLALYKQPELQIA